MTICQDPESVAVERLQQECIPFVQEDPYVCHSTSHRVVKSGMIMEFLCKLQLIDYCKRVSICPGRPIRVHVPLHLSQGCQIWYDYGVVCVF